MILRTTMEVLSNQKKSKNQNQRFFSNSRPNNIGLKFKHFLNTKSPWLGVFYWINPRLYIVNSKII
jgi:hypothetical protein